MLKVVSLVSLLIIITGCGTKTDSIDYYMGGEEMPLIGFFSVTEVGDVMKFELSLTNEGEEQVIVQFPSGQQFEITVIDENDEIVYRYSEGKMFTMAIVQKEIEPKQTVVWEDEWKDAVPGNYTVIGELQIISINGEKVNSDHFKIKKKISFKK